MGNLIKRRNFWVILSIDLFLLCMAYVLSYLVRFEGEIPAEAILNIKHTIWLIIPFKLLVFFNFKLYKGMWRYTGINDLINLIKATFVSSTTIILVILYVHRFQGYPRSVFVIDAFLTLIFIGGIRLLIRLVHQKGTPNITNAGRFPFFQKRSEGKKRLLIIGAGDAGEKILRELQGNPRLKYNVVGFVDDDRKKHGMQIHGVPVLGDIDQLLDLIREHEVDELLIAIASATREEMRRIVSLCKGTGLKFRIIPGIGELIDGRLTVKAIRDVAYEDLMGREPVQLEMEKIGEYIKDKSILVTGAGGSIGSELGRQIAQFGPKLLVLLDFDETALFHISREIRERHPDLSIHPVLGDILDKDKMDIIFSHVAPQLVFHAAAYKHVPVIEDFPEEAVRVNILGTKFLGELSQNKGVEKFILISTDKVVNPTSVMGASKRVAEMVITELNHQQKTQFLAVRFGNVLGSRGSVIPLFQEQIKKGGPVTITHPEMKRYFMTIPEAVLLVLQAGAMGSRGEVFVLDMGEPVKIYDVACELIRLSGLEPEKDIPIIFTGIRPGEKLFEEVLTAEEGVEPTAHPKIFKVKNKKSFNQDFLNEKIKKLEKLAQMQDKTTIIRTLHEIIPTYNPNRPDSEEEMGRW